ncbi:MAG: DpnI domain-containing protein [Ghiorsea sp.]
MDLKLDTGLAKGYKSASQIARVVTEGWVNREGFCPSCGTCLSACKNNTPVADFYCACCSEQFELKSKSAQQVGNKIVDGAYDTMLQRIQAQDNPNFFFLTYDKKSWEVSNYLIIPKHYFTPNIIEKRKPLAASARRAGWIGCNINLIHIPEFGRVFLVRDKKVVKRDDVLNKWNATAFLSTKSESGKGWLLDVMHCLDMIPNVDFTLNDVYEFEAILKKKYPENNFIKDKLRQQLQMLRDKGLIAFKGRGKYQKVML